METIVDYVKENGHRSFFDLPFNEVDALVLSQFSYLKWDHCIAGLMDQKEATFFSELDQIMDEDFVFSDERYIKKNKMLYQAMKESRRFNTIKCNYYTNIIDETVETQFCAMLVFPEDALPVVVFRGTDENIVGWKEDFNMAFVKPVTGQKLASLYINQVTQQFQGQFVVCGHSKGGNLAVFSSIEAGAELQDRIERIFSFDGPGFRPEIFDLDGYNRIKNKIHKLIPHSSLVGMILENHEHYEVVDSYYVGMLQHDPFSWKVDGLKFKRVSKMDRSRLLRSESFNEWVLQLDDHQLLVFVETLFDIIHESGIKTTIEFQGDIKKNLVKIIEVGKNIDPKLKGDLLEMSKKYFEIMYDNFKGQFLDKK